MANQCFGLDIGTRALKSVWLEQKKGGIILKSAHVTNVPTGGMVSSSPIDEEQMAKAIHDHVAEAKIGTHNVHISLSDNQVYTKVIEMPMLSDKELDSAVYWEAEQYIPAQLSTIMLDHMVLRRNIQSTVGPRMQVLLVGAPISLLQKYQKILTMAGMMVVSIETEMLASIRAIVASQTFPVSLIISIGNLNTSIAIVQSGILVFAYTVPIGSSAITRAIAQEFGFTQEQAEEYKKAYGIADQNLGGKISKAIDPILNSIVSEAKKALAYYNNRYKGEFPVTQIVLSGGTAKLPGIDVYFVKNIGTETVVANPWKSLSIEQVPQDLIENGSEFTVAVGLGLKSYE